MLISFAATNFRSIYERQEISFLATKYAGIAECIFKEPAVNNGVLPLIAIYGANASGKTNILKALYFFHTFVKTSYTRWEPDYTLPADPHFFHLDEPTTFEGVFFYKDKIYSLSFTYNSDQILQESLRQGRLLVYRRQGNRLRFGKDIGEFRDLRKNLRDNALFLSTAAQANHPLLKGIHSWFSSWDTVTEDRGPEEEMVGRLVQKESFVGFYTSMISTINPEIIEVIPPALKDPKLSSNVDPSLRQRIESQEAWAKIIFVHSSADGKRTAEVALPEESRGTQSYFALATVIWHTLMAGGLLILDEADQSLHPTLLRAIIALFQNPETNSNRAQVILNTHETVLLSPEVLRPDQVWFVEKPPYKNSQYYCLADFKGVRSDTKAQRAYLEGRFGAIPFVEDHADMFKRLLGGRGVVVKRAKKKATTA